MTPFFWLRWIRRLLVALLVLAAGVFLLTCADVWWVARADQRPRSDAIVVLGAAQYDGRPSVIFADRLAHAAALFRAGVAPWVVTVGGREPGDAFTEAAAGRGWLAGHGVPAGRVLAVPAGRDTLGSLQAVAAAFRARHWHRAVLVSDPWHELRCRTMARDLGLVAATSPDRTGPAVGSAGTDARYIAREALAYLYYRAFHADGIKGPSAA